jgi:hypothetical protein
MNWKDIHTHLPDRVSRRLRRSDSLIRRKEQIHNQTKIRIVNESPWSISHRGHWRRFGAVRTIHRGWVRQNATPPYGAAKSHRSMNCPGQGPE